VWFVAFADITDPAHIAPMICQALKLVEQPDIPPVRRLVEWLATRRVLLVLDNLEPLAPGTAVISRLLASAPGLRLLATSREPLHLAGEQQYEVPVLATEDAVELFSARAHSVAPRLTVDPDITGRICERLDRLPLAIELAAARIKTLQPGEILTRLEQGLPVLATGPRDAARRQQTLTATIDWSYDLLAVDEQRLFAWLSVFAGGFTFAAAEAICDAGLDALQALTDRSLLMAEDGRYAMLQTLREYALDRLERSAEGDELRRRHADWYAGLLRGETDWDGSQSPILRSRPVELENLRAALEWAAARGETETVAQLTVLSCQWAWSRLGRLDEAERWLTFSCEHQDELPLSLRAAVMSEQMELLHKRGEAFCEEGSRTSNRWAKRASSLIYSSTWPMSPTGKAAIRTPRNAVIKR
jgi:predicted ATPase